MQIIILLTLLALSSRTSQNIFTCVKAITTSMQNVFHTLNDILTDGMWFDKEDMTKTFYAFKTTFEECSGKVPGLFRLEPCLLKVQAVLENQDSMYHSVLDKDYNKAFDTLLGNTEPMIEMMDVCINSASLLPFMPLLEEKLKSRLGMFVRPG